MRLAPDQVLSVTEYMHPRLQEVCETLPAGLGAWILRSPLLRRWLEPRFAKGRHVETTSLRWFVTLRFLASLRRIRRSTLRYREEQARIEQWLDLVGTVAQSDREAAAEVLACQQLLKGYSDTFERGLRHFGILMREIEQSVGSPGLATRICRLRDAALADEHGTALSCALATDSAANDQGMSANADRSP